MTRQEFYHYIYDHVSTELNDCYDKDRIYLKRMAAEEQAAKDGDGPMFLIFSSASKLVSSMRNLDEMYEQYLTGTSEKDIADVTAKDGRLIADVMNKIELNRVNTYDEIMDSLLHCGIIRDIANIAADILFSCDRMNQSGSTLHG